MKCPQCDTELTRNDLLPDGSIQCSGCGAIYRRKKANSNPAEPAKKTIETPQPRPRKAAPAPAKPQYNTYDEEPRRSRRPQSRVAAEPKRSKSPALFIVLAVVIIAIIAAAVLLLRPKQTVPTPTPAPATPVDFAVPTETQSLPASEDNMASIVPDSISPQQQMSAGSLATTLEEAIAAKGYFTMDDSGVQGISAQMGNCLYRCPSTDKNSMQYSYESFIRYKEYVYPRVSQQGRIILSSDLTQTYIVLYPYYEVGYTSGVFRFKGSFASTIYLTIDSFDTIMHADFDDPMPPLYPDNLKANDQPFEDVAQYGFVPSAQNETVTYSWFEGTQYKEEQLIAKYAYGRTDTKADTKYVCEGTLTKYGYEEFPLSGVPAGTYMVAEGTMGYSPVGIIEVVG